VASAEKGFTLLLLDASGVARTRPTSDGAGLFARAHDGHDRRYGSDFGGTAAARVATTPRKHSGHQQRPFEFWRSGWPTSLALGTITAGACGDKPPGPSALDRSGSFTGAGGAGDYHQRPGT